MSSKDVMLYDGVKRLARICHEQSVNGGWWNDPDTGAALDVDTQVPTKLLLIHSEISEATEGFRKNQMDDHLPHRPAIEAELADALIRIGDLAEALGLDLAGAVVEKMEYNAHRADHKPENRAKEGGKKF